MSASEKHLLWFRKVYANKIILDFLLFRLYLWSSITPHIVVIIMITQPLHTFRVLDEVPGQGTELQSAFSRLYWLHIYILCKKKDASVKQFAVFNYEWQSHFHRIYCNLYHLQKAAILPQRWLVMREEKAFGWSIYNFFFSLLRHYHSFS